MTVVSKAPPVALTLGDPSGVGPELALAAWRELAGTVPFFLIGDVEQMRALAGPDGGDVRAIEAPAEALLTGGGLPVLHHPLPAPAAPGTPDPANAPAVVEIIARGVELVRSSAASALCTNPINKKVLKDGADFPFPGHTEFLAYLAGNAQPVMMLAAPGLRVVPVTIHLALSEVPGALTADLLDHTLRTTHAALVADFGIDRPRLAVAGLNPHAGEGGAMGREELDLILPVIGRLRAEGLDLRGPRSADTMFHPRARADYDAAVCMYHDQALIPIKTIDFDGGVNVTLGLDFVRTSPDHGTAYDIAGRGLANPSSLIAALRMAAELGATRAARTPPP